MADSSPNDDRSSAPVPEPTLSVTLFERVRSGQPAAWERLLDIYSPLVYGWCRRCGLQVAEAADIAQEVFTAVHARLGDFSFQPGLGGFRGWLRAITHHKLGDWLRAQRRPEHAQGGTQARDRLEALADLPESSSVEDEARDRQILIERVLELVRCEFEPRTWQAFCRVVLDGRLPADIALETGMTVQAVYKAKSRILCRLRQELADEPPAW